MRRNNNTRMRGLAGFPRHVEEAAVSVIRRVNRAGLAMALALLCLMAADAVRAQAGPDPVAGPLAVQNPRRIAGGPEGQVLVTDRHYGTIVAIDRDSLQPVWSARLPDGSAPFGLAVHNRLVFVGDTGTQAVNVYRIARSGGVYRFDRSGSARGVIRFR